MKTIALRIGAVVAGLVAGMIVMMGLHMVSAYLYPPPPGLDLMSSDPAQQAMFKAWMSNQPAGMFLIVTLAHGLGCMAGAVVATLLDRRRSMWPAIVIGGLFTLGGVGNLKDVPHPGWWPFVDLPVYLLLAVIAGMWLTRRRAA